MSRLEPASAVAASKCWLARLPRSRLFGAFQEGLTGTHPKPCNWCVYPVDVLLGWINALNARADFREGTMHVNVVVGRTEPDKRGNTEPVYGDLWERFESRRPIGASGDGVFTDPEVQAFYSRPLAEQRAAVWRAQYGDEA